MSFHHWEPDVELYEPSSVGLVIPVSTHFKQIRLDRLDQDLFISYEALRERHVTMQILGFMATDPVVRTTILQEGTTKTAVSGALIGCKHPTENALFPGVLRTKHFPIVQTSEENFLLPTPRRALRISRKKPGR